MRRAAARLSGGPPPISVLDCVERWDGRAIVVLEDRLHPGLRGGLSLVEGRRLIILNRDDPPARARFTLAHELGHIVLGDLAGPPDDAPPDGGLGARPDARHEALCDRFAVELLLPASLVRFVWAMTPGVAAIARRFEVSRGAARRRVRELGLAR